CYSVPLATLENIVQSILPQAFQPTSGGPWLGAQKISDLTIVTVSNQVDLIVQIFKKLLYFDTFSAIEQTSLSLEDLSALAQSTRLLINAVGPYNRYSSPVVEACAKNQTHYLDVTGETPWVFEMIQKYHGVAKDNKAIIIPEVGVESSPSDLLAWSLATLIRQRLSVGTREVVVSADASRTQPSGGSLATLVSLLDHYGLDELKRSLKPFALSPIPGPKPVPSAPFVNRFLGIRVVPDLGTLTTSIGASPNVAIVERTWGLLGGKDFYGPSFQYKEYRRARNKFAGMMAHFAITLGFIALTIPPLRWLLQIVAHNVYAPGQGPSKQDTAGDSLELRAIAEADQHASKPKRAMAKFLWRGGLYHLTALLAVEAAMVILNDDSIIDRLGGGLLTPAMLGQPYIDRLRNAGVVFENRLMPDK
ncbi:MAG: hypothetical protein Q9214_004114, partial [Letrouitia sp. 1 TL-2023]